MIEPLRILQTAPQLTAFISFTVPREEVRRVMGPGLTALRAAVAAQDVAVTGPWFTHHLRDPGETFDFEIGLPVAAPVAPKDRVKPALWPTTTVARATYHGGHEGPGPAWGLFKAAIEAAA